MCNKILNESYALIKCLVHLRTRSCVGGVFCSWMKGGSMTLPHPTKPQTFWGEDAGRWGSEVWSWWGPLVAVDPATPLLLRASRVTLQLLLPLPPSKKRPSAKTDFKSLKERKRHPIITTHTADNTSWLVPVLRNKTALWKVTKNLWLLPWMLAVAPPELTFWNFRER